MTNEQLAVLLSSHHAQLVGIFNRLLIELKDIEGLEYNKERVRWIGEGDEPKWPICLDDLSNYIDDIEQSVKDLIGEDK